MQKTKAPNETDMYKHKGLAWAMAAQGVIRSYKRCLGARPTPQGLRHKQEVVNRAQQLALSYVEDTSVLERAFAN
eukprot:10069417-Karenia_brevis.AAC.1